jgi:choice-of-anchor A domain-containing protein
MRTLFSAALLAALFLGVAGGAQAGFVFDTLGSAGPGNFAILALDTSNHLHINGPAPAGTLGNVGVVNPAADFHLDAPNSINGNVLVSGNTSQFQNTGTVTGMILGNQSATLNAANMAALSAASTFAGLPGTSVGQITSGTITATNPGGLNVLNTSGINVGGNQVVTLSGPPGTQFVINVSGNITLNSGRIVLSGGLTPADVVFNVIGNGSVQTSGGLGNESILNGILLAPNATVALSPGQIVGELIGGQSIDLASGAEVIGMIPAPPSVVLLGLGGLVFAGLVIRSRQPRAQAVA